MGKLTMIEHLKACAEAARAFTDSRIGVIAGTVSDCLEELEGVKEDKPSFSTATLTAGGWAENTDSECSEAGFAYMYKLAVSSAKSTDSAECVLDTGSLSTAYNCGMCQTVRVTDGSVYFYAATKPSSSIKIQLRIIVGAAT